MRKKVKNTRLYHYFGTEDVVKDVYVQWFEIKQKNMSYFWVCELIVNSFWIVLKVAYHCEILHWNQSN